MVEQIVLSAVTIRLLEQKVRLIAVTLSEMRTSKRSLCFDCSFLGPKMVLVVPPLSEMGTSKGFVCFECSLLGPPIVVVVVTVP